MKDFTEKTRLFIRTTGDPFFDHFFNEAEIDQMIIDIFNESIQVTKDELFTLLNHIVSLLGKFYPDSNTLTPGKTDELKLLKKIERHNSELQKNLNILLNQYGYDTWRHINPCVPETKEVDAKRFLDDLLQKCQRLEVALPTAKQVIKNKPGKKTGNNSMQGIQSLICDLILVYEKVTGKSADKNFQQDRSVIGGFKGQFLDFVRYTLLIINDKFKRLYPDRKASNPFKICLDDTSLALVKHIYKTISNIKAEYKKAKQEIFNFYFGLLLIIYNPLLIDNTQLLSIFSRNLVCD